MPTDTGELGALEWLADAPMFIDAPYVAAFYDAILRPEHETLSIQLSERDLQKLEGQLGITVGAKMQVSNLIKALFPFLNAEASASAEGKAKLEKDKSKSKTVEFRPISTPQRQLVQLAIHYAIHQSHRVAFVNDISSDGKAWRSQDFITRTPRGLVFLNLPPKTMLIPLAAEVAEGKVVMIWDQFAERIRGDDTRCPKYAEAKPDVPPEETEKNRREFWSWLKRNFDADVAIKTVEDIIADNGRIWWIGYRMLLGGGATLHLHANGRTEYDTGVFAYRFIKRAFKHGIKIIGTMKSAPDMNVLAIFEC